MLLEIGHLLLKHLQIKLKFFLVSQISPLCTLRVLLTKLREVMLVTSCFILVLTDLFLLVGIYGKIFMDNRDILLGMSGIFWLFEADKSVELFGINHRFNP